MADDLQSWHEALNRLAYFNLLAVPDPARPDLPSYQNGGLTEVLFRGAAHRLEIAPGRLGGKQGYRTANAVGAEAAPFEFRWSPIPQDLSMTAESSLPPTAFDPGRSQRIAVTDADFAIGQSGDRVKGYGVGRTYPIHRPGKPLTRIAVNGHVTSGTGALAGHSGMFALNGLFAPPGDFQLNVFVMIKNPGALYTTGELPPLQPVPGLPRSSTFLQLGTFIPTLTSTVVVPGQTPADPPVAFIVSEKVRLCESGFSARGAQGLVSRYRVGRTIGEHHVKLGFSLTSGSGHIPSYDVETFRLQDGTRHVGTLRVQTDEIRAVLTPLDGVPADMQTQMFAGFGPVRGGDGAFAGVQGFQINLGAGSSVPHLTSILYIFDLADPTGRFRS
jgi:hypothetical protein